MKEEEKEKKQEKDGGEDQGRESRLLQAFSNPRKGSIEGKHIILHVIPHHCLLICIQHSPLRPSISTSPSDGNHWTSRGVVGSKPPWSRVYWDWWRRRLILRPHRNSHADLLSYTTPVIMAFYFHVMFLPPLLPLTLPFHPSFSYHILTPIAKSDM